MASGAITSDNLAVAAAPARGSSIVIAGDRSKSRKAAHRHSKRVRILKFALPLTAIATTAITTVNILGNAGLAPSLPKLEVPQIVADNLKMHNPHYEGFNDDGGRYWVKAETAQQDLKTLTAIHLQGITGELTDPKKQKTNLVAARGLFDNKSNVLELYDSIEVTGDGGLTAKLTRATIKTKENIITSDQPSVITMGAGQISSNQLTIRQKAKEYTFLENVRTHMKPKDAPAPAPEDQSAQQSLPFGKPGEPVEVLANRLDIDDVKKTAFYTGKVIATQGGATMTAPEMTVTYEGSVAPEGGDTTKAAAQDASSQGTKVKQIVATESVVLTQPNGQTATSHTALFDTVSNTAVLEGDVVLSQGEDKKAVGDRLDYDQTAQTMVLTGPVVVTQGSNVLRGRRLTYHRATSKMQLTAPGDASNGISPGRITAHFVRPSAKPGAPAEEEEEESGGGISFGAAFKTDANSPYDVVAEKLEVDDVAKTAVFTGNVSAVQGSISMRSQELTAFYTGNAGIAADGDAAASATPASLTHLTARKKVVVTAKDGQTATGDWAEVDVKKNTTTLGGAVVLTQGKNIVNGTRLVIDMNTGEATIKTEPTATSGTVMSSQDGASKGEIFKAERPSAVFYPGQLKKSKIQADSWQVRTSP
ncbi:LPS export ABC transporter periplasmic protein LptC [Hyphomicrobium sp.]|uniref:LPS export ABC transporter periplasmic protein LptC n=1 Tax=Hyphomicrobium sp. TaxID=82 RepID=UPI002D7882B9|nr:LPS export ABC transporter periplasmic protein LptC [Hyphomicrobium sp.]HET6388515.1 LPS export ABC transporter periplasmic protein LptC [Hyphomicrobium sp.]